MGRRHQILRPFRGPGPRFCRRTGGARRGQGASAGDWSQALNDLYAATAADPNLAEAQSSLGWVLLQGKQPAETAIRYFDRALAISPDYMLAAAGKGFAEMAAGKANEGARQVVEQMKKDKCIAPLLATDALLAAAWVSQDRESGLATAPGNVVMRTTSDIEKTFTGIANGNLDDLKRGERMLAQDPFLNDKMSDALHSLQRTDPDRFDHFHSSVPGFADFTKPGGLASSLIDAAKSAIAGAAPLLGVAVTARAGAAAGAGTVGAMAAVQEGLNAQTAKTGLDNKGWNTVRDIMDKLKPTGSPTSPPPRLDPLPGFPDHSTPPGGATTSLNAAYRDSGNWTLKPVFGLVHPMM